MDERYNLLKKGNKNTLSKGLSGLPIVILGGFLSPASIYKDMRRTLAAYTGHQVYIVNTRIYDWFLSFNQVGWFQLLNKLDLTVKKALQETSTGKVILVGHSQGGVLSRLYLTDHPFLGRRYNGKIRVALMVSLGSPHLNMGGFQRGGTVSRWVENKFPGAYFSPSVSYASVAGKAVMGDPAGSTQQRFVSKIYQEICGGGETGQWACAWGDGIVPVQSALLPGSVHIILDGVAHYSIAGSEWYGSEAAIVRWWEELVSG